MAAPTQVTPPPRVNTLEATPEAAYEAPPRVYQKWNISFQPERALRQSPQCAIHIIPCDTEPMPPTAHQKVI